MVKRNIIKIDKSLCNGCTLCVDACTEGALEMKDGFAYLPEERFCDGYGACISECSPGALRIEEREAEAFDEEAARLHREEKNLVEQKTTSLNWPFKLNMVSPEAPFFKDKDIYIVSDCVPFAMRDFHETVYQKDGALLVSCPKFDKVDSYKEKLKTIIENSHPRSVTVVHMEIPCCHDIYRFIEQIIVSSGAKIPLHRVIVGADGTIKLVF